MIRQATPADRETLVEMVRTFNETYYPVPVDTERLDGWIDRHMSDGLILLSGSGFIGGLVVDDPVRNWTALVETGWYDTGRTGATLLRHFIRIGRDLACDEVRLTTLTTTPARAVRLLERMGFEEIERSHSLTL